MTPRFLPVAQATRQAAANSFRFGVMQVAPR